MALKLCLGPDQPARRPCPNRALVNRPRCASCAGGVQQAKDAKRPARRSHAAITTNAELVRQWVEQHGWWCPGVPRLGRPAHPATRLSAQHDQAVALGGDELAPSSVLCVSCNSADGATVRRR